MNATTTTQRMPRFAKASKVLRTANPEGLADDQIRRVAPSVFAADKHASRSNRYTYTPTAGVLFNLRREGFVPMEIRQATSRIEGKEEFTKHMMRLRYLGQQTRVGETVNEIVMVNSHDGTSSHQLMGGVFREICSNGMIVMEGPGTSIRIPHKGDANTAVIDGCIEILNAFPQVHQQIEDFRALRLDADEQRIFAQAALQVRYPLATPEAPAPVSADTVLQARRSEDREPTLWHVLNRVQENTVMGHQRYVRNSADGHSRRGTTREVRGIDNNVNLNRALWTLAAEMHRLKTNG